MSATNKIVRVNSAEQKARIPDLSEIWSHRHMIYQLVGRDFKSRYTQSIFGVLWVIVAPIMTMLVYTFVFGRIASVPSYDIPYPIFNFSALVPWQFFIRSLSLGSKSIINNQQLITDVYIPRIIVPIVTISSGFIDMLISFGVFLILMLLFGMSPAITTPLLLVFLLQLVVLSVGISLLLSTLQVRFRDISPLVGFATPLLVFLSPVAYPTEIVDGSFSWLYALNPMVGILDGWRWAILGIDSFSITFTILSLSTTLIIFVIGFVVFTRSEATFADWI